MSIQNIQNIYNQFLDDLTKLKKIQSAIVNQTLDKIDRCKAEKVLKLINELEK
jgi:hypothetical protein